MTPSGIGLRRAVLGAGACHAAFVMDAMARYRASPMLRLERPRLWTMLQTEERGLRENHPIEWAAGEALRGDAGA